MPGHVRCWKSPDPDTELEDPRAAHVYAASGAEEGSRMAQRRPHALPAEDDVNGRENEVELRAGQFPHPLREDASVDGHELRGVRNGVLGKPGSARREQHTARRLGPTEIAGQRNADDSAEAAPVQGIVLDDHDRSAEARRGPSGRSEISPPHVTLGNHQSLRSSVSRAAAAVKPSGASPTASQTQSIAAVTSSGACLATYSRTARL